MGLETVVQALRCFFQELESPFTPEAVARRLQREADWLRQRLRDAYEELPRQRRTVESLTEAVVRAEKDVPALTCRIESWLSVGSRRHAYRQALELEQLRQNLEINRGRLRRLEREYRHQVMQIQRLQKRRDRIEERLRGLAYSPQTSPSTSSAT